MSATRDQEWLEEALAALDLVCFDGHLPPLRVHWHRYRRVKTQPTLGDYLDGRIRISTTLQSEQIPVYYVLSVVYHEALHALLGHEHSPLFLVTERQFPRYTEALLWERDHGELLCLR